MKKILIFFLVSMFSIGLSAETVVQYGTDKIIWNTMQDTNPEMYKEIINGDIFSVFNLTDYTTSLQKKKFLESEEGLYYSRQLKKLRKSLEENNLCGLVDVNSNGKWRIRELTYDLNLGGFLIPIGTNYSSGHSNFWTDSEWGWDASDQAKGMFNGIYCSNLNQKLVVEKVDATWPKYEEYEDYEPRKSYYLLWKCDENLALEIEKNGAIIWYQFSMTGNRSNSFNIYSRLEPSGWGNFKIIPEYSIIVESWYGNDECWESYTLTYYSQLTVHDLKIALVNPITYKTYGINDFSIK